VLQQTINAQKARIERLEAQLEALHISPSASSTLANGSAQSRPGVASSIADLCSPVLDHTSPPVEDRPSADVIDWFKREDGSLSTFDGLVNSGAGLTQDLLVEHDHEDSGSDDTDEFESAASGGSGEGGGEDEYGTHTNHHVDREAMHGGEDIHEQQTGLLSGGRMPYEIVTGGGAVGAVHESSLSPASSSAIVSPVQVYRQFSSMSPGGASTGGLPGVGGVSNSSNAGSGGGADNKLSTIPSAASAFGLIAEFALKRPPQQQDQPQKSNTTGEEGVEAGPGSKGFFRPSEYVGTLIQRA
jgi:hypothetical protein